MTISHIKTDPNRITCHISIEPLKATRVWTNIQQLWKYKDTKQTTLPRKTTGHNQSTK